MDIRGLIPQNWPRQFRLHNNVVHSPKNRIFHEYLFIIEFIKEKETNVRLSQEFYYVSETSLIKLNDTGAFI